MWSFTKIVLLIIGLYLVVTNIYDMSRDPSQSNIIIQGLSVAIGGGLALFAFNIDVPVIAPAARAVERVVRDVTRDVRDVARA